MLLRNIQLLGIGMLIFLDYSCTVNAERANLAVMFPRNGGEYVSTDGMHSVYSTYQENMRHHNLYLRNLRNKHSQIILEFDRHAEILWSPSSDFVFVNASSDSGSSECRIYDSNGSIKVNLSSIIIGRHPELSRVSDGNIYIECKMWQGDNSILVETRFFGNREGRNGTFSDRIELH